MRGDVNLSKVIRAKVHSKRPLKVFDEDQS